MSFNPLTALDDWLIDSIFQPISDWIRVNVGWSSNQVAAPFSAAMGLLFGLAANRGITLIDQNPSFITTGVLRVIALLLCLLGFYRGWLLITEKFPGKGRVNFLNARRATERISRIGYMVITFGFIAFLAKDIYSVRDESQTIILLLISSMISGLCSLYFEACTDLPQPPKRQAVLSSP